MKRLLLGLATAVGMTAALTLATPADARVVVGIGPFIFDAGHDRCYDYWFRERHPDYCYYDEYNEYWWSHHHRGWDRRGRHDRDWDRRGRHDRDWDRRDRHDHDRHDRHRDRDHDHRDHDHHH